jgi:hypothetical protein
VPLRQGAIARDVPPLVERPDPLRERFPLRDPAAAGQYESPFPFTRTIKRIVVDISDVEFRDLVAMAKVAMGMQ